MRISEASNPHPLTARHPPTLPRPSLPSGAAEEQPYYYFLYTRPAETQPMCSTPWRTEAPDPHRSPKPLPHHVLPPCSQFAFVYLPPSLTQPSSPSPTLRHLCYAASMCIGHQLRRQDRRPRPLRPRRASHRSRRSATRYQPAPLDTTLLPPPDPFLFPRAMAMRIFYLPSKCYPRTKIRAE